jgi:AAA ATPase domain
VSRRVSSPELIGRAAELTALAESLEAARASRGGLVLVEGDAGMGKTRLVEAFAATVRQARVLTGGGIPLAGEAPYAPVIDILRALAALHPPAADVLVPRAHPCISSAGGTRSAAGPARRCWVTLSRGGPCRCALRGAGSR